MNPSVEVLISDRGKVVCLEEFSEPVELGRQAEAQEVLFERRLTNGRWRMAIAASNENTISRKNLLIEPLPGRRARLTNTSGVIAMRLGDGGELRPGQSREVALPTFFEVGERVVRLQSFEEEEIVLQALPEQTSAPSRQAGRARPTSPIAPPISDGAETESLIRWIQGIVEVFGAASDGPGLLKTAAKSVVDLVGLDSGRVLTYEPKRKFWEVAESSDPADDEWAPSRKVLARVLAEKRTFWQDASDGGDGSGSLLSVITVVVAPILDRRGEVIAVLYGERRLGGRSAELPKIRKLDALLVELLASGVASGLARLEQEKAALTARVQFEQFFTAELAEELSARPDMLKGQELEVTVLFCDLRGFSRISERVGPATTIRWVGDVMGELSDCVLKHRGALLDYIGDELIAMWGAPKREPDQARLACLAALDMLEQLKVLNARWEATLGEPVDLGIGINTGIAMVGNTGSHRKFKYGAVGSSVNLASRVQGATRYFKTRLLITGSTRAQLDPSFACRRLCSVGVVNIAQPVEIHELAQAGAPGWDDLRRSYELALGQFEGRDFASASQGLGKLLDVSRGDGPTLALLSRVVQCLIEAPVDFSPVWRLPGK